MGQGGNRDGISTVQTGHVIVLAAVGGNPELGPDMHTDLRDVVINKVTNAVVWDAAPAGPFPQGANGRLTSGWKNARGAEACNIDELRGGVRSRWRRIHASDRMSSHNMGRPRGGRQNMLQLATSSVSALGGNAIVSASAVAGPRRGTILKNCSASDAGFRSR